MFMIPTLALMTLLATTEPAGPSFTIRMPSEKIGYPGVEYWATIEGPGGKQLVSFAIYTGKDAWTVPLRADALVWMNTVRRR